ncbi:MAG: hypothetical protein ACREKB_19350, partial [Candidatus Rokuibacteriota bacterium]
MSEGRSDGWIGRPLKRREDHRLLTGAGSYVDDLRPPGCVHVALLRSPHADARIAHLDVEAARRDPRVLLVATGKDVLLAWLTRRLGRPVKWVATRREDLGVTHLDMPLTAPRLR